MFNRINQQTVLDKLKAIIDPDLNKDIVSLGFVKDVKIQNNHVSVTIELTTPACPVKSMFEQQAKDLIKSIDGVKEVSVVMTSAKKQSSTTVPDTSALAKVTSIIAVSSCKGGVGKSTLCAHMAWELSHRGYKVGLADLDIYGPSLPMLFNLGKTHLKSNAQQRFIPHDIDGLKVMSFGFILGDAPAIMRGPIVSKYIQHLLLSTEWGELDYLFLDMPPGTGDVHLTVTQSLRLNGAVIITTPHGLSLVDVARGILMYERVSVPILGVIDNMAYFQPDEQSPKHYIFGNKSAATLTEKFGVPVLAEIPVLPQLSQSLNSYIKNITVSEAVDQTIRALGKSKIKFDALPKVTADPENIRLQWPDGKEEIVSNFSLRLNSQDALSVNEMTGKKLIDENSIRKDIAPTKIIPIGNYALGIEWNDGHSAGIYPYKLIAHLAQQNQN